MVNISIVIIIRSTSESPAHALAGANAPGRSGGFVPGVWGPVLQFAIDSVGVLAATAGSVDPVVAALAHLQTALDGRVA